MLKRYEKVSLIKFTIRELRIMEEGIVISIKYEQELKAYSLYDFIEDGIFISVNEFNFKK